MSIYQQLCIKKEENETKEGKTGAGLYRQRDAGNEPGGPSIAGQHASPTRAHPFSSQRFRLPSLFSFEE